MKSIKEMVKDNKRVRFTFFRDRQLFYQTECGFEFPVPIDDIGNATFLRGSSGGTRETSNQMSEQEICSCDVYFFRSR